MHKRTTIAGEEPVESPDLIARDFDPASSAPGQRFVGAVTGGVGAGLGRVASSLDSLLGDSAQLASGILKAKGYSIGVGAGGWDSPRI